MFDRELETTIEKVILGSEKANYEFITVEYLLLCLLENPTVAKILINCGADLEALRNSLVEFVATTPIISPQHKRKIQPTLGFSRVLDRAKSQAAANNHTLVSGADLLIAMYSERDSYAVYLLKKQDVMRIDIVHYLLHGIRKKPAQSTPISLRPGVKQPNPNALQDFATNLNEQAKLGLIDPIVGRTDELMRIYQILMLRHKNNPLLVGEAGVGKTAIVHGLAYKIMQGDVPSVFQHNIIYSLDLAALIAGTKYRGEFEKRLKILIAQLQKQPNAILFIDDIHNIIGAGATSSGASDASNLLKPILSSRHMRCIGSTSFSEYRNIFAKNHALARRFQHIDVSAPSIEETISILQSLKPKLEQHHKVSYNQESLHAAANMSERYLNDRNLPDKAIDVLDEAGAYQSLYQPQQSVGTIHIEEIIAKIAKIPAQTVNHDDKEQLRNLEQVLKVNVFGQDKAISDLSCAIKLARAGLKAEHKPIGSFLFAGPTGVGKTEVAKQLAKTLGIELIRFDMSEYMERHAISRLIGAPPGYVGFDQGGLLTEAISKTPHAVLLLDEIEKAHPELFNLLLQVMDNATLTDTNGRKTDFRSAILIMTTNAGAEDAARASMGFMQQDHASDAIQIIKKSFSPEFRNRLDAVIQFNNLTHETVKFIVLKFINELKNQLQLKGVSLELSADAYDLLAKRGFDPQMGARPMVRLIQDLIKRPLAEDILFGRLTNGGEVMVYVDEHLELRLNITSAVNLDLSTANVALHNLELLKF